MTLETGAATSAEAPASEAGQASASQILKETPWYGELPETTDDEKGFKAWVEKKGFKDPVGALKGYRELERHVGANRVMLPGEKDDITQWEGWDRLGVPKDAKGYEIPRPTLPEGMQWDEGFETAVKDAAARLRIHPAQLRGLVDVYAQAQIAQYDEMKQHQAREAAELQGLLKEWGADREVNVELARRGGRFLGLTQEEIDTLEKGVLGGKNLMTALVKFGKLAREGASFDGDVSPAIGVEALKAELQQINEKIGKLGPAGVTKTELERRSLIYRQLAAAKAI